MPIDCHFYHHRLKILYQKSELATNKTATYFFQLLWNLNYSDNLSFSEQPTTKLILPTVLLCSLFYTQGNGTQSTGSTLSQNHGFVMTNFLTNEYDFFFLMGYKFLVSSHYRCSKCQLDTFVAANDACGNKWSKNFSIFLSSSFFYFLLLKFLSFLNNE